MNLTPDTLRRLLGMLDVTAENEIDCGEFLDRLAGYLERVQSDPAAASDYADMLQHMRVCPECCEEFETLYEVLREEGAEPAG